VTGLADVLRAKADEHGVPGSAMAVLADGEVTYACHGVTNVVHPLPVDRDTLFLFGSQSKTYTATAAMCLVSSGALDLDAPVRRYLPELRLPDEQLASTVTVLQCLNHTNGWSFQLLPGSGEGDDALAASVDSMAETADLVERGGRPSYNNAGFALVARIIERLTGTTFEDAARSLVFEPLGLAHTAFHPNEVMTRRFAVGHNQQPDGSLAVMPAWKGPRATNPWGGLATSIADAVTWARFHLGETAGDEVLSHELVARMQEPTADLRGSALGDAVGVSWMLRDVDGVRTVGHDGSMGSQFSALLMVPERKFAVVTASNASPDGLQLKQELVRWALEEYAGVRDPEPEPVADPVRAAELAGVYRSGPLDTKIRANGATLVVDLVPTPEAREQMAAQWPEFPPFELGLLADGDRYVVLSGQFRGYSGVFTRDADGAIAGMDFVGRQHVRVGDA
jgi:CubicO group peptidase (beta-lactamase class C family)